MIEIVDVPLYKCSVVFLIETTREEWKKFFEKEKPKITEADYVTMCNEYDSNTNGCVIRTEGNDYICYVNDGSDWGLCIHEMFHVAHGILWDRNHMPDEASEPTAYLLEYLVNQFLSITNKKRKR